MTQPTNWFTSWVEERTQTHNKATMSQQRIWSRFGTNQPKHGHSPNLTCQTPNSITNASKSMTKYTPLAIGTQTYHQHENRLVRYRSTTSQQKLGSTIRPVCHLPRRSVTLAWHPLETKSTLRVVFRILQRTTRPIVFSSTTRSQVFGPNLPT